MRLLVLLFLILATAPVSAQQPFPIEFEVGLRRFMVQGEYPFQNTNTQPAANFRVGLAINMIDATVQRREGYDSPSLAKIIYLFCNAGRFLDGEQKDRKQLTTSFFDDLGLGGNNSLFVLGYKINRYREKGKNDIRMNNWFSEASINFMNEKATVKQTEGSTTVEGRTTNATAMNFNLTLGYQFMHSIRVDRYNRQQIGRVTFAVSPQLHGYHVILPKGITTVNALMIQEKYDTTNHSDMARSGFGGGLKLTAGWTFKNESIPVYLFVEGRQYLVDNSKTGPGYIWYNDRPLFIFGISVHMQIGTARTESTTNIRHLERYRSYE